MRRFPVPLRRSLVGGPWVIIAVGAIATVARLLYWVLVTPDWTPTSDAHHYVLLAHSLADGDGFSLAYPQLDRHPTAFRPPLYPAVLAVAVLVGDVLWPARLLSVLLGAAVAVLAAVFATRLVGRFAGFVAGTLVAVYPPLLANDTVTLSEPLGMVLLVLIALFVQADRWALAGVTTGGLLLTRPNVYVVVLIVIACAWRAGGSRAAGRAVLAVAVVVVPWIVRNQVQVGTPRLVTSDAFTLAAVFAAPAQQAGGFVDPVFDPVYDSDAELRLSQFDEAAWSRELLQRARDGIREDPSYLLYNARRNFLQYFELRPGANEGAEVLDGRNLHFRRATLPLFYVVTALGLIGMWRSRHQRAAFVVTLLGLQFALVSIAIIVAPRLRTPFDVVCCVMAALVVTDLVDRWGWPRPCQRPSGDGLRLGADPV